MTNFRKGKNNKKIKVFSRRSLSAAAQRNVYVVFQPRAERHMPTLPKFRKALREIGLVEIANQINPEQIRNSPCYFNSTGKFRIYLNRIHKRTHNEEQRICPVKSVERRRKCAAKPGNHLDLKQTYQDADYTFTNIVICELGFPSFRVVSLELERIITLYRALKNRRKIRYVQ